MKFQKIFKYFLAFFAEITDQERTHHSNPLLNQVEISAADRQTLVSWLINVCRSPAQLQVQSMHQVKNKGYIRLKPFHFRNQCRKESDPT